MHSSSEIKRLIFILFALTAVTLPIDQLSKQYARKNYLLIEDEFDSTIYQGRREEIFVVGSERFWISLSETYVRNHGASWGIWSGVNERWRRTAILLMGLVATMILSFFAVRLLRSSHVRPAYGICGVIIGAFGNMLDRLRIGYVVDFLTLKIGVGAKSVMIPSFNVADIIIVLALIWLIATIQTPAKSKPEVS
jgi:lipoprotein signal peptidase